MDCKPQEKEEKYKMHQITIDETAEKSRDASREGATGHKTERN